MCIWCFFLILKSYTKFKLNRNFTDTLKEYIYICLALSLSLYIYIYHHHHHHVAPPARISLTLSRHFSLSFIASGRSSGLHPVSSHSCCMYVRAGRPTLAHPYVGVHRSIYISVCATTHTHTHTHIYIYNIYIVLHIYTWIQFVYNCLIFRVEKDNITQRKERSVTITNITCVNFDLFWIFKSKCILV